IMLENEILYGHTFDCPTDDEFILPLGRAKVERVGHHVTITAFSIMVGVALKAAEALAEQGIEAEVINLRSLRPFDTATVVESVKKTNRIVSVEEGWPFAGIGAEVAMQVVEHAFDWLDAPPVRVHGADVPLPYAANLEKLALPQPDWVVDAVKKIVWGEDPMATNILMPALSPTMTEGTLSRWLKKEGENVRAGDVIAEIETDKATMEVEAVDEGVLGKILVADGTEGVKVNEPIAILVD